MDKLGLRPALDGCVPHSMHVGGTPLAVFQVDWPGWLCDRGIVSGFVWNIKLKLALWPVTAKDGLEMNRLENSERQHKAKNAEASRARRTAPCHGDASSLAAVHLRTPAICVLFLLVRSEQPFQCWHGQQQ